MSSSNSTFVSPPPPSVPGAGQATPPGPQQLGPGQLGGLEVGGLPVGCGVPLYPAQPLMSPAPAPAPGFMSPCVRYSFPLQQTMFSLALPDPPHLKGGLPGHPAPGPGPAPAPLQLCQPVPEVSVEHTASPPQGPQSSINYC